ncbi:MAG: tetratricopeptide repeat protein [Nitrospirae bacterium]|nr:tetratricopeptide repeat protein [Nitrospirota bacterium]
MSGHADRRPAEPAGWKAALIYKPAVHILLICLLGFVIYSNTFHSPFQWDESDFIVGNPIVRNLAYFKNPASAEGLPVYDGFKSRFIGYLTFALNYRLHGFHVVGYHVVNLVVHLINAILVYFLVVLTFRTPYFSKQYEVSSKQHSAHFPVPTSYCRFFALAVALLFVSHPVQTEAVTYIFQRFASLVSLFYLLSLVLYIKGRLSRRQAGKPASYFFAFVSAVLAMKTKENAFTLPVVITLYEFLFFTGPLKSRVLRLVPFLLTMLIIPLTIIGASGSAGEIISEVRDPDFLVDQGLSGKAYLLTQLRVVVTYLRLLLLPVNQNLSYSYPLYHSLLEPPVFLSLLLLLSLFGAAIYLLYRSWQAGKLTSRQTGGLIEGDFVTIHDSRFTFYRLIAFGIFWFFITLSVESSIIPIPMLMDEYRIYLPSVGFFLSLTAAGLLLLQRPGRKAPQSRKIAAAFFIAVLLTMSSATFARNILWKDKVSLWKDVVRKNPGSPRGYNNLGLAYAEKGLHEKAIGMYERSTSLNPSYVLAYTNLGVAYAAVGKTGMAIDNFEKAIALNPNYAVAYSNLARAYGESGRIDKAAENYSRAVTLAPYDGKAYHGLGTAYVLLGRLDDALAAYSKFIALSPDDPEAYRSRGVLYARKGDLRAAAADFQESCSLGNKESCEYLNNYRREENKGR